MIEVLNNLGDILHNIFDLIVSFLEGFGNGLLQLWELINKSWNYIPAVLSVLGSFLPPSIVVLFSALLTIAVAKLIIGRDS